MWIYSNRDTIPLASLGDAAVSFLENPDKTTKNMSLASRKNIDLLWENSEPAEWVPYRYRWYTVGSRKLWFGLIAVCALFFVHTINALLTRTQNTDYTGHRALLTIVLLRSSARPQYYDVQIRAAQSL